MSNRELKAHAKLGTDAKEILDTAAENFGLSPRAYMRSEKVARTIADLDNPDTIETKHIAESLQYCPINTTKSKAKRKSNLTSVL